MQKKIVVIWLLFSMLFLAGLLIFCSNFPDLVESVYTRGFYAFIAGMLSPILAKLPFSLSEISLYAAILFALFWLERGIRRRRFRRTLLELLAGVATILLWFYLAWGLNYLRPPLTEQLHLSKTKIDSLTLRENFLWSIDQANTAWHPVAPWNLSSLDEEIEKNYAAVVADLNLPSIEGRWPPKFLLVPGVLDYTLTSGIFGPFFHEVHLNSHLLPLELPFVLAHEKAHGRGLARESEASFIALLVCWRSENAALHYSAYFSLLGHFRARYHGFADADTLRRFIRPEIIDDIAAVWARYEKYQGPLAEFSHRSYDFYLRANQVEGGVENYSDVVDLVIKWRERPEKDFMQF